MVDLRAKGARAVRECVCELEGSGFLVSNVEDKSRWARVRDCFGLFDVVAINGSIVRFVQVACNRPHCHRDFLEFSRKHRAVGVVFEQWVRFDGGGWKKFFYNDGVKEVFDGRVGK